MLTPSSGYSASSGNVAEAVNLEVECVDCRTWGTALVTTSGVSRDQSIIGDIVSFFENPVDTIVRAFDMDVKIEFEDNYDEFIWWVEAAEANIK